MKGRPPREESLAQWPVNQGKGLENNKEQAQAVVRAERGPLPLMSLLPRRREDGASAQALHTNTATPLASLVPTQPHEAGRTGWSRHTPLLMLSEGMRLCVAVSLAWKLEPHVSVASP